MANERAAEVLMNLRGESGVDLTNEENEALNLAIRALVDKDALLEALKRAARGLRTLVEFGILPGAYRQEASDIASDFERIIANAGQNYSEGERRQTPTDGDTREEPQHKKGKS